MKKPTKTSIKPIVSEIVFGLAILLVTLLALTFLWVMDTWKSISFGEIVLQLSSPVQGTNSDIINMFYLRCLLPAVLITAALVAVGIILRKRKIRVVLLHLMSLYLALVMLVVSVIYFDRQFGVLEYYQNINIVSDYIENNYVDPASVAIAFPESKRNLIYIYLESMEITYADTANGGYLDDNCIPELTKLAEEGDCFAGSADTLNGAKPLFGTQYTMGGMMAQSAGLPMFGNTGNTAEFQEDFYPGATVLGDILQANGYKQELMVGSDAVFGGRAKYFQQHGGYEIFDINTAKERGLIPEDYNVWWGFEDEKLFEYAKMEILDLAESGEPFNFTMLTADTHFPDGYLCDKCGCEFDSQYENVIACSSKQVYEFVEWAKEQDFYSNTTIVICGDHLTMDSNFCNSITGDYDRRTYVAIVNSATEYTLGLDRTYSTLDLFPTTLASMGCTLGSDRLALGTNLYSGTNTLIEDNDISYVNRELAKDSPFVETNIASWDKYNLRTLDYNCYINVETKQIDKGQGCLLVKITGIELLGDTDRDFFAVLRGPDGSILDKKPMDRDSDLGFSAYIEHDAFGPYSTILLEIEVLDEYGRLNTIYIHEIFLNTEAESLHGDINEYIDWVSELDDATIFIATQDEATANLADSTLEKIRNQLSVSADMYYRGSLCAVIDNGNVLFEQSSPNASVGYGGELPNGCEYSIISAGFDAGSICSIMIDGTEYAPNSRGINFVIYDNKSGEVIDTCVFDTYESNCLMNFAEVIESQDIDFDYDSSSEMLDVSVTVDAEQNYSNSILYIWDKDTKDDPLKIDMEDSVNDEYRVCEASVDISGFDPDTLYVSVYIKNDIVIGRYRAKVFS